MSDEWGPWIEHDGKGCPCIGMIVNGVERSGWAGVWVAGTNLANLLGVRPLAPGGYNNKISAWSWAVPGNIVSPEYHIIRYRIRKPRGMTILEELLENLPEEVDA